MGNKMKKQLLAKIQSKELCMGVIGLGYVGLPLAVEKQLRGFEPQALMFNKKK